MNMCMRMVKGVGVAGMLAAGLVLAVSLTAPPQAEASIHEIIAALCRAGGEEVVPPGQNNREKRRSSGRCRQADSWSIDDSDPTKVVLNFDPTVPNSKFMSLPDST